MKKLGIAFCGSFCTTSKAIELLKDLKQKGYDITPIFSEHVREISTRFGDCDAIFETICEICQNEPITTIVEAEPIGPLKMFDALIVAPCTGNTLAKLTYGITDNTVTMACKSHLRNTRPLIIAIATNDGLSANASNIGNLLNRKNYYFVPFGQDDPKKKPNSLVCDMNLVEKTLKKSLKGCQIQPMLL